MRSPARVFTGSLFALALVLAACDVQPLPTATAPPLPTAIPTPDVPMGQYAGAEFIIDYPEAWIVQESESGEVRFGPSAETTYPGMSILDVGAMSEEADALLNAHRDRILATLPEADYSEDRIDAPGGGRSDFYQDRRAEPRMQYWVTFYVQEGRAYRVVQWSPVADWDRWWSNLFYKMLEGFAITG